MSRGQTARTELLAALEREIRKVSAQSVLFSQAVAERLGISSSDLECLDIINLKGPVTAGQLAEATGLTTGAITGVIDRLERAGFARRAADPQDRRRVLVELQPDATGTIAPLFESLGREMMTLWSSYSDEELALILDFHARTYPVMREETAKLRAGSRRRER